MRQRKAGGGAATCRFEKGSGSTLAQPAWRMALPPATVQVHDAHGKPQAFSPFLAEEALDMPSPQMHEQEALGQDSQESLGLSFP